jgi:hypothetical protein
MDRNITLFHQQSKERMKKNNVKKITMEDGSKFCDFMEIKDVTMIYFEFLYTKHDGVDIELITTMLENSPMAISSQENTKMLKPIEETIILK